jgi:hypothetical protein
MFTTLMTLMPIHQAITHAVRSSVMTFVLGAKAN